jgi:predicted transcriptional regulator of viral defense system
MHRFALPERISAPYPACVSLQSALFHHGLIEQLPAALYVVTLARRIRPGPL